jgi:molybdopterin-guanine dinucleotide biosynthesis protein A
MYMNLTLTTVLLTGGESRRMGTDKATLIYEGQPLWCRQLDRLRALQPETILISARTKPAWCPPDAGAALDEPPSRGPLSGLAAALKDLHTTHLLVLAVDLPQMTAAHLQSLWAQARPGRGVIPQNGDYFEPLCAVYPVESLALAAQSLAAGQLALQALAKTLIREQLMQAHPLKADERQFYHNGNTPDDLKLRIESGIAPLE